jgi:hypothetical protein
MANSLVNFIPEIWSKKLSLILDKSGVMSQCVNRDYEGEIKNQGDTVKIRSFGDVAVQTYTKNSNITYTDLTDPMQSLIIDQQKYFAFKVDDIDKAQADINILEGYLKRAKVAIDLARDTFLLGKYVDTDATNIISAIDFSATATTDKQIYGTFVALAKALKNSNAISSDGKAPDGKNPWVVINPDVEAYLLTTEQFTHYAKNPDKALRQGTIGTIAGFDVLVSTNMPTSAPTSSAGGAVQVLAGINDAITFASQVTEVKHEDLQGTFGEAIKGLYVYGAKTVVPKGLATVPVTVSAKLPA